MSHLFFGLQEKNNQKRDFLERKVKKKNEQHCSHPLWRERVHTLYKLSKSLPGFPTPHCIGCTIVASVLKFNARAFSTHKSSSSPGKDKTTTTQVQLNALFSQLPALVRLTHTARYESRQAHKGELTFPTARGNKLGRSSKTFVLRRIKSL